MQISTRPQDLEPPVRLVKDVAERLRRHALWDSLAVIFPPVLALIYGAVTLYRAAMVNDSAFFFAVVIAAGGGLLGVVLRFRSRIPSLPSAARLIDQKSGAKDRFLTLATIDPAGYLPSIFARLRLETFDFVERIDLPRDFPLKLKRSRWWLFLGSILIATLIHFLLPLAGPMIHVVPVQQRIRQLADEMSQRTGLKGLAHQLRMLAAKLEDPNVPRENKQAMSEDMQKEIEKEQAKEEQKDNRDLLGQAASTLKGLEEQQSSEGQEQRTDQEKGGGGIQSKLPQDGQGEGKQSQGSGGEGKKDSNAQLSKATHQDKTAQGEPKEPGQDQNQKHQGDTKGNQPDQSQPGKNQDDQKTGKDQGGSREGAGKNQASDEPPQGTPPTERFYKAGEGKAGLKDARYVTVQLPEDITAESRGEGMVAKGSKGNRVGAKVPVSNVPLPAQIPNSPTEKQQLPIEYRGIIR